MATDAEMTPGQLVNLVRDDQRRRWLRGEQILVETYLERYPSLGENRDGLLDCIYAEYLLREELNDGPDADDYLDRFPEFASELRRQFELHVALETSDVFDPNDSDSGLESAADSSSAWMARELPVRFGDYELLEELNRGGMGVVFKARQTSLNRIVAVKLILAGEFAGAAHVERFRREAEATAGLRHPNIVAVHEVGQHQGHHYFSMEYVEGRSLAELQRARPLAPRQAASMVKTLAEAVHHVHEQGTLHRDLKPSNVLIDADGQPRITDFGLAKYTRGSADLTSSGTLVGTPSYMAPEAAGGKGGAVGPTSDVYSLGAILYELLTDRPPFGGETPLETLWQVLHAEPTAPRLANPRVPRDLETICLKCLQKPPSKRYASAAELAADLRRFLDGRPIAARPAGLGERTWKWARRRPTAATLVAVSCAALMILAAGSLWHVASLRTALDTTEGLRIEAENQGALARQREQRVREYLYAADMRLAFGAWNDADVDQALRLLERHRPRTSQQDLRSFDWHYLWRLCHAQERTIDTGHGEVYTVVYSPDGKWLATAGKDGTARLWDAATGQLVRTFAGHQGEVSGLSFAPDGQTLATTSDDHTVRLWDVATGSQQEILKGHADWVFVVAFSPDGQLLASGGRDNVLRLWSPDPWRNVGTLEGHSKAIESLAFSPDGELLATGSADQTVILWDVATRRPVATLRGHQGNVTGVAFSSRGDLLASCSEDHTVKLWDVATRRQRASMEGHEEMVQTVAFSPDDGVLASAGKDRTVHFWDVARGTLRDTMSGPTSRIWYLAYSPDGEQILTAGSLGRLEFWDATGPPHYTRLGRSWYAPNPPRGALVPGDESLIVELELGSLWRLSLRREQELVLIDELADPSPDKIFGVQKLVVSPGGGRLAFATGQQAVGLYDLNSDRHLSKLRVSAIAEGATFISLAFSPDGRLLAGGASDHIVWLWNTADGTQLAQLQGHRSWVHSVAFSPTGEFLVTASDQAIVWDVPSLSRITTLDDAHMRGITHVVFSRDGRVLATAGRDRTVKLWDTRDWKLVGSLQGHPAEVTAVGFSPDGRTLAALSRNGTLTLWNVATQQQVTSWTAHTNTGDWLEFSSNDQILVTGGRIDGAQGEFLLWRAGRSARVVQSQ